MEILTSIHKPNRFRQIHLGELELTILTDGFMRFSPISLSVEGMSATNEEINGLLEKNFLPTDHWDLSINVMVVKSRGRLVLLDTGTGILAEPSQGWLMTSISEAGFDASDFTDIIISHVHSDHIGGLIDSKGQLAFPNAAIHMAEVEYDFWTTATVDSFKKSLLYNMKDFLKKIIQDNQRILGLIKPNLHFIDFQNGLYDNFHFELASGHTPGHTVTTIESRGEKLLWTVDLFHSGILFLTHPEWGFLADTDTKEAIATRVKWLPYLADNKIKIFAYHLPYPGLGHVRRKDNYFEWVPEVFATP